MPLLDIKTNVKLDEHKTQALLTAASRATAEALGKSENYVMVLVQSALPMQFAGNAEACAYLELKSIGLPAQRTADLSATLCNLIAKQLGVGAERVYIEFSDAPRHLWGWNGRTF